METLQVGIKSLFKSSASEPWKMTFVSPSDESEVTVELGKNGSVEVGPRLSEVLSSIEQYNTFPRTVTGEELDALGMATRDSFIIKQLAGRTVSAEIGFRPFRRFMNPSSPKVKGVYGEPKTTETVVSSANEFKAQTVEIHGKTSGGKPTKASNPIQDGDIIEIKYRESGNNQIDFFDALDDRREEIWTDTNVDSKVRIGDVLLIIPPLAIDVNRTSSIQKVKTLRSKSSMMVKGGSSATTITLQLYFHDLESINGRKVKMHKEKDRNYYMDGLRPLIAQFKKAPFLPIDNKYINETLGIDSVALVNLAVQTVPGFPRSLSATLTLAKFDHQAYMPQVPRLGDVINYPMLRWYYQEPLRDDIPESERSPYRTYLKPIPSRGLNNSFKFQKAVEDELQQRKQAIQDLRNMDNPIVSQTKFETPDSDAADATTQLGREYKDGIAAQKVLEQYKRYKQLKDAGKITKERDSDGRVPVVYQITQGGNTNKESHEIYKEIYGDAHDDVYVMGVSHYAPFESWIHAREANWDENSQGSIKLRLYSQNNIDLFSSNEVVLQGGNGDLTVVLFKGSDIAKLNKIIKRGNSARKSYEDNVAKYEDLKNLLDEGESTLTLEDYDIEGLLPMSMTVMYENQFSNIQLEGLEGPSFQFLGGQDPYVQVLFEATEEGVAGLRYLLEEVDRYSREYRTGITSGFMGVKNDLFQLFGISTVMVENVQIRTKPGFPGRFEVELALCGFNKTQKRSERLEGISPIYGDVVDRSTREAKNYDPSADEAIVEIGMRKLEVYPDLELPTYNELISALPYIGADCNVYENRTGGIYVDPDFYVATPTTMREIMRDESKTEQILKMKDFTGIEMATSSQSTNPLDGDADMWDLLKSVDSRSTKIDPTFSWSGSVKNKSGGKSNQKGITFKSKEIEDFVKDKKKLKKYPSYDEWKKWSFGTDIRSYNEWKKNPNPEEWEVYNHIYKFVDDWWVDNGYVYDDRKTEETDVSWKKITYASTGDMYKVNYNYIASKDPEILKSGQKKELKSDISLAAYRSTKSKPTRERIANYIKSVIHARSKWKQVYSSGVPLIDGQGNAAGIGGVPLSSEATSLNVAKRLLWDWKYNLEYAIGQLFDAYEAALEKKNIKWKSRPWEWMVTAYSTGTIETDLESQFLAQVHSIFETYYNGVDRLYGSPTTTMNIKILQRREQLDSHQMGILQGNKDDIIEDLLATGYRKDKKSKKETKEWLEDQSSQKVQSIYEDWMKDLMKRDTTEDKPTWYQVRFGRNQADINNNEANRDDYSEQWENYKKYSAASDYIDNNENNRLVNQKDPQEVFPDMFTDMIEYDQRMRLVRAFPAFQMFIVDEGRWMTNYRLWDNLYGFNAIQSIDVHKSRKIAADTAVIQMTNIYSNLTSRSLDQSYEDWDVKFWDNLVFGNPNEEILAARKELLNAMFLQTGARIHLRMGYGSSVVDLPVMFNGTITELNAEETVTIVAQGDGIELGNVISGDPNDNNKGLFKITEPRDLICELLTSKGNWFYDAINAATEGELFRDNPLGILHFGQPGSKVPEGTWKFFNENYGEAAQNIYSSNGIPTFSQYAYADGSDIPWSWDTPVTKWLQPGDEENIVVPFYNNTVWDITQTIAYCTPDYMAAVHPFEMRSTLFFGKPYWYMAYKYDSRYEYNAKDKNWIRYRDLEHRKPYSQVNMFFSQTDIISNKIKASEEGVYTNVIVNYDGKQSPLVYADFDIRLDKQKTTVLDAQIVSRMPGLDFWTSEKQAMFYAMSAVRDYMKDMYKGQLVVMGDPTIKPHNIAYMTDVMNDMHGNFLVKAVTHHFSLETGFISSVEPDAFVVNDDMAWLNMSNWVWTLGAKMASAYIGYAYVSKVLRRLVPSSLGTKAMKAASKGGTITTQYAVSKLADLLPDDDEDIVKFKKLAKELERMKAGDPERAAKIKKMQEAGEKVQKKLKQMKKDGSFVNSAGKKIKGKGSYARLSRTVFAMRQGANALSDGKKALNLIKGAGTALGLLNPLAVVASILTSWATETIAEKYRRKKATMQAVMMMPLQYQGKQYTAGINGHKGMVIGDSPGKLDSFLSGAGLDGKDGEGGFLDFEWAMDTWNWLTNAEGKDYAISEEDLQNGNYNNNN